MTRKEFLGGCLALGALPTLRSFVFAAAGRPLLKLGVLSDIHIQKAGDEGTFTKALEFFKARQVDGVLIAGDMANTGLIAQLHLVADAWYKVFPDGKYPDGRKCEQLFIYGNHDMDGWKWERELKDDPVRAGKEALGFGENAAKVWEECFREKYEPIWIKQINGCAIVGGHWGYNQSVKLADFLKAHASEIDPAKPFIFTQHAHPYDTCMGTWAWGHDDGASTRALSQFPNAVAFSGHSHYTLTDDRSVWQGAFTSVNTSSLSYSSIDYSLRENINGNGNGYRGEKRRHAMPQVDTKDGRQGMVVSFFEDHLSVERREFVYGEKSLGTDWLIPWPAKNDGSYSFAARKQARKAPEFAADAKLECKVGEKRLEVEFPAAKMVDDCRALEYEVTAVLCEDDVELVQAQRRVMASGFHLPEELADKPSKCVFNLDELPCKGHYRIEVRPLECFGRKGAALVSSVLIKSNNTNSK